MPHKKKSKTKKNPQQQTIKQKRLKSYERKQ